MSTKNQTGYSQLDLSMSQDIHQKNTQRPPSHRKSYLSTNSKGSLRDIKNNLMIRKVIEDIAFSAWQICHGLNCQKNTGLRIIHFPIQQ